jgi:hypothetical protein
LPVALVVPYSFVDDNYSMHMVWHYNKYVQNLRVLHALHGKKQYKHVYIYYEKATFGWITGC